MSVWRSGVMSWALFSILVFGGCSEDKPAPEPQKTVTTSDVKKEFGEAVQTLKDYTYEQRQEYYRKMTEELNQIDAKIDALKQDIEAKPEEAKKSLQERLAQLKERQTAAHERLKEILWSTVFLDTKLG